MPARFWMVLAGGRICYNILMKHLIIFHESVPELGGIETAIQNILKLIDRSQFKVTILYSTNIGSHLLFAWSQYADVRRLVRGEFIYGDVCLLASNYVRPAEIVAKKWIQWIHADYEMYKIPLLRNPEISAYICVSDHVAEVSKRLFGIEPIVIYNLVDPDFGRETPPVPYLRLITCSRLSQEKGFTRMLTLARLLVDAGVDFDWDIYGNCPDLNYKRRIIRLFEGIPQVCFRGYQQNISRPLSRATYLVQLSDHEGCCLSVMEALTLHVPVLVTPFATAKDYISPGVSGYILPFSMEGIDLDSIVYKIPSKDFNFYPKGDIKQWEQILN